MNNDITLCFTIGKRPELLQQTIESLLQFHQFDNVIAINDFGDDETNKVFKSYFPDGKLICLGERLGHHKAVDRLYKEITTPYIFHCEDDWIFKKPIPFVQTKKLLEKDDISLVCFRSVDDFPFYNYHLRRISKLSYADINYYQFDKLHKSWHGYTFNPHLIKKTTCSLIGEFQSFDKERHVSRWFRKQNKYVAFLDDGCCFHIGEDVSVSYDNHKDSFFDIKRRELKYFLLDKLTPL